MFKKSLSCVAVESLPNRGKDGYTNQNKRSALERRILPRTDNSLEPGINYTFFIIYLMFLVINIP